VADLRAVRYVRLMAGSPDNGAISVAVAPWFGVRFNVLANRRHARIARLLLAACIAVTGVLPGSYRVGQCQTCCKATGGPCCGCCRGVKPGEPATDSQAVAAVESATEPNRIPACCRRHKSPAAELSTERSQSEQARVTHVGVAPSYIATISQERCSCCSSPRPSQPAPVPGAPSQPREESFPALVNGSCVELTSDSRELSIDLVARLHDPALESGRTRLLWFCAWRP